MTKNENADSFGSVPSARRARPGVTVDVSVPYAPWEALPFDPQDVARRAIRETLALAALPRKIREKPLEVSLLLANDDLVQTLNHTYRGKNAPTNVLSFPLLTPDDPVPPEGPVPLGDIVLSFETIHRESDLLLKRFQDHMTHLVVHGTLHLLGYDHETDADADLMEDLEIAILGGMGLKNPYS